MTRYSWTKLFLLFLLHPTEFARFWALPKTYTSLDEWLDVDKKKCEIVARVLGCKNAASLQKQQEENMEYRKRFTSSFSAWLKYYSGREEQSRAIDDIALKYEARHECHRVYAGKGAGVHCYCNN